MGELADRAREVFLAALELDEAERGAYVRAACAGRAELEAEVHELLGSLDAAPNFLERPLYRGPRPELRILAPGDSVGPYTIAEALGEGGSAASHHQEARERDCAWGHQGATTFRNAFCSHSSFSSFQ